MYGTLVSTITVGVAGASDLTWTSIPQTATDLIVVLSARQGGASIDINAELTFNNDTGANYSQRKLIGNGSSSSSTSASGQTKILLRTNGNSSTSPTHSNAIIYIPNYSGSTAKSVSIDSVIENNATTAYQEIFAGLWTGTAAITTLNIGNANFYQYTTASLYILTKGSGGATVS